MVAHLFPVRSIASWFSIRYNERRFAFVGFYS
jgi:hypothetical protein